MRGTLREHKALQDRDTRGERKDSTHEVALIDISDGAPLKTNTKGKSEP